MDFDNFTFSALLRPLSRIDVRFGIVKWRDFCPRYFYCRSTDGDAAGRGWWWRWGQRQKENADTAEGTAGNIKYVR